MIEDALVTLALAASGVTDLIGTSPSHRIYPGFVNQGVGELTHVCYLRVSDVPSRHLGGRGIVQSRFQFTCWSTDHREAATLAEAMITAFDGYRGTPTGSGVIVKGIFVDSQGDIPELSPELDARRMYGRRVDFLVHHITA